MAFIKHTHRVLTLLVGPQRVTRFLLYTAMLAVGHAAVSSG